MYNKALFKGPIIRSYGPLNTRRVLHIRIKLATRGLLVSDIHGRAPIVMLLSYTLFNGDDYDDYDSDNYDEGGYGDDDCDDEDDEETMAINKIVLIMLMIWQWWATRMITMTSMKISILYNRHFRVKGKSKQMWWDKTWKMMSMFSWWWRFIFQI